MNIIIYNQFHLSVCNSELINYLGYLALRGEHVKYIFSFYSFSRFLKNRNDLEIKLFLIPLFLVRHIYIFLIKFYIKPFILSRKEEYSFHGFYFIGGYIACQLAKYCRTNSVFNMRSVEHIELQMIEKKNYLIRYAIEKSEKILRFNLIHSWKVIVVSENMKRYLIEKYGRIRRIEIIPLLVSLSSFNYKKNYRIEIRSKLQINETDIVFVYLGSIVEHQMIEYTIKVFNEISKYRKDIILLILTNDISILKKIIKEYNFRYMYMSISHENISKYLNASDYGFILRYPHLMNSVASPTKFAEYLMSGVRVITTNEIGDYSIILKRMDLGVIVPHNSIVDSASLIIKDIDENKYLNKRRHSLFAKNNLSLENYSEERYLNIIR